MSVKRKRLSLKDKLDIIIYNEKNGLSVRKLAEKFDVGRTQINDLLKNKSELKRLFEEGGNPEQKRKFPQSKGFAVDQMVYTWFCKAQGAGVPLTGPLIRQRALMAAESLQLNNFKASNGWLDKFCRRHNVTFKTKAGSRESEQKDDISNERDDVPLAQLFNPTRFTSTEEPGFTKTECKEEICEDTDFSSNSNGILDSHMPAETLGFTEAGYKEETCDNSDLNYNLIQENTGFSKIEYKEEINDLERESPVSSISNMSEACAKLRDLEMFFLCRNNDELATDISQILLKCEDMC